MDRVKDKQTPDFYEFDAFRIDLRKRRLMRDGEEISLTPKEFSVLLMLVENAGRTVEKDEMLGVIWADSFVEETTLARNVSWLRKKLAAGANDAKIIETVPKRGYRFLPEVSGTNENTFIFEEKIVREIEIQEVYEIEPSPADGTYDFADSAIIEMPSPAVADTNRKALPGATDKTRFSRFRVVFAALILAIAVSALFYVYFFQHQTKILLATKIVPFSGLPGRENSPAFSPDGKQIAFAWDGGIENGNSDIYVKLVGAGEPVRLTDTLNEEMNPVFAPDGKSIAFVRVFPTHNEIILIPALGGADRKIDDKASYASLSFSPDGKFIAHANLDLSNNEAGIFTINLETGEKARLTRPTAPAVDHTPRFSPDGKFIAFIHYFSSFKREIFIVPATGGEPRQITSDDVRIYGLAWNADSRSLFFTSFRRANQLNLWQLSTDENSEPQMISTGSKNLNSLAVSPDGKTVAFVEEISDENIWEIELDKSPRPLIRSTRADHSQQFSPDGAQIVFASDRTGNYEIWISDADGKNSRQLTESEKSSGSPRFSPDGKFVAYDAQTAGSSDIFIVSVNGGAPVRLTEDNFNNALPAWSADGRSIFFLSNRSGSDQIWKMPASGGEAVQITRQGAFEMFAASDDKTIIYSKGAGKFGLWSVGTNGGDEKPIRELDAAGAWRSWSVAPNGVYYVAFAAQPPFQLKFFEFATRQTKIITDVKKPSLSYYSNLGVAPDGKKFLYAQQDQSASSIMLADLR